MQCIVVNSQLSGWLPATSGVPQDSILGPLFFVLYINDLPSFLSSSCALLYADDTKCFQRVISLTDCSLLQCNLDSLALWSELNCLSFNTLKCSLIRFSHNCASYISLTNYMPHQGLHFS